MTALAIRGLSVRFGTVAVVDDLNLDLEVGSVTGLIGPNGAGKTTVIDALAGMVPAAGSVTLGGRRIDNLPTHRRARLGLARTFQALELFEDLTVAENLLVAGGAGGRPGGPGDELAAVADVRPGRLTSAQRSRLAVARATAASPAVLLLDEPAAGLDGDQRRALGRRVRELAADGTAVLLVEHDMALVLDVSDRVAVLDRGRLVAVGPPADVRADAGVVAAYLGDAPTGPAGTPPPPAAPSAHPPKERELEVRGLTAGYDGRAVVHGVDLSVAAGEVVALLGLNGAGKSTTLLAVAGALPAMAGEVRLDGSPAPRRAHRRARLGVATVTQGRSLFDALTVAENLRLAGDPALAVAAFPALEPLLRRRAGLLSGGEARMVALARALSTRPRLLLVDEVSLGLAPALVSDLLGTLRRVAAEDGTAVLVVEQHVRLAAAVADRAYAMVRGRITGEGPAGEMTLDGGLPG